MKQRLQKLIAASGLVSRRAAEELLSAGRVTVNGAPAALGESADPDLDVVLVDGKPLPSEPMVYIMLNKPRGYLSAMSDDRGRRTVAELTADVGARVYPIGRLDYDSEGLLLMTNDGALAQRLEHPSFEIKKNYLVRVRGEDIDHALPILRSSLVIDGYRIRPAEVRLVKRTENGAVLSFTIAEGRNRQIRKMCEAAGLSVLRLRRISEGNVRLGALPGGKWRPLTDAEIENLQKGK